MAPFFDVTFADFWIADQMNSLAAVLLDVEFFVCYLVYGIYSSESSGTYICMVVTHSSIVMILFIAIQCNSVIYGVRPLLAVMPAWWRFAQCLRRYRDTRKVHPHLVNAGKYSTSFFVVFFSSLAAGIKSEYFRNVFIIYFTYSSQFHRIQALLTTLYFVFGLCQGVLALVTLSLGILKWIGVSLKRVTFQEWNMCIVTRFALVPFPSTYLLTRAPYHTTVCRLFMCLR